MRATFAPYYTPQNIMTALTKKELANAYKISVKTLCRRLKSIQDIPFKKTDKILYPHQLEVVFSTFGNPYVSGQMQTETDRNGHKRTRM